ncbi:condensin-2 complex subunit H2-like isoform X2 [Olea europaea var. sylvestris]|uniref:condensin-2 complex subunit H2-like isoform X2 n=1 Tax=Olea europaea var. sylvestris TaxID=158386 RepID=UPI000C1D50D8|nr:condensin-2 complex subunit H2-like isoform X2 [Olea europaea var. sylvestris]
MRWSSFPGKVSKIKQIVLLPNPKKLVRILQRMKRMIHFGFQMTSQLANNDLYRDFILLDSCDAVAVNNFLNGDCKAGKGQTNFCRGSSLTSRGRKSFQSPIRQSGGNGNKLAVGKNLDNNFTQSPSINPVIESNNNNVGSSPPGLDFLDDNHDETGIGDGYPEQGDLDESDDDDPWKPTNPHEPGNLKVKPYKKVKANKRQGVGSRKHVSITEEFPLAKLNGPTSSELTELWEAKRGNSERQGKSQSTPLYEKLRESLVLRGSKMNDAFYEPEDNIEDHGYDSGDPDSGPPDFDFPENKYSQDDVPSHQENHDSAGDHFVFNEAYDDPGANASLEDLCRSHLDSLLASLAESEQTELATRVSTWKQRIEQNLEEQDARPPFDIHEYGDRVLDKLSMEGAEGKAKSFEDVVRGQEKHDVARTFSALLQLVNNGDVDLHRGDKNDNFTCHTAANPFYVRLLRHEIRKGVKLRSAKKRVKSPLTKVFASSKRNKPGKENRPVVNNSWPSPSRSTSTSRFSPSPRKASSARGTPEGKKRRKSRLVAPLDLHAAG